MTDKQKAFMDVQSKDFFIETYASEEEIQLWLCSNYKRIEHYAYITHDKDVKEDGTPKVAHIHLLARYCKKQRLGTVYNSLEKVLTQNYNAEIAKDVHDCYDYLTHKQHPEKAQYAEEDIQQNDTYFASAETDKGQKVLDLLHDLDKGTDLWTMARKYGRDFVLNYTKYEQFLHYANCHKSHDEDVKEFNYEEQ